jgi:hypothetical protein
LGSFYLFTGFNKINFVNMSEPIVNRVSESSLTTLDLEAYYPVDEVVIFVLKDYLFMGLILKEKDFREALKNLDWQPFSGKIVTVTCSADAIIPMWAYMLVASSLQPIASDVVFGNHQEAVEEVIIKNLRSLDMNEYAGQRVVVKGCGEKKIGERVYLEIAKLLRPAAKSIMYGEPCSTVPVYKKTGN